MQRTVVVEKPFDDAPAPVKDSLEKPFHAAIISFPSARGCDIPGLDVCAKTGTAETGKGGKDHAWFTCFAPERGARLVVTVVVEYGGFGAEAALPVAKGILLEARELGYFE